ncbi:rhodanese-like domain-containing protein [Halobiforma nitratireducens]|uniref:Rhodanese-like protein n=1 Tax=Halobiforma nitratireducens JCM 10879 TaxID=1227454 RepID=M0LMU0_9EURY|nr:rhodanese-like domain-containing protein [Halobiforma nitratireducens]EMA33345.1 Rhodanese-like protein [Halobiforma nitratireducens JCM 10879]
MDGEISPDDVKDLLENDDDDDDDDTDTDVRIVDIRDERNFRRSHIPGSENVPFHELTGRVDEFADADHIVTVCPHGEASVQAARLIGSYEGIGDARVESMAGGLEKYGLKFGLAREDDDGRGDDEGPTDVGSPF